MAGKKWCEYCRINLSYSKKQIQEHEETRLHLQNKQRAIKFQRIKTQQAEKAQREISKQNALLSTANIPKAKKGSELEKQVQEYRNEVMSSGKAAIHQLIAERTKGMFGAPIQFPDKEDLVLAENFISKKEGDESGSDSQEYEMWKIDICEQTGDPCFVNAITQAKYYEPPKGHVMSVKQKQQWEYLKEICKEKVDVNQDNVVKISEWEEVPEEEDYFNVNRVIESEEEQQKENMSNKRAIDNNLSDYVRVGQKNPEEEQVEVKKSWLEDLEKKVNNNEVDANEVMETVIFHQLKICKNLKEKNETLKKLINNDIQIRQTLDQTLKNDPLMQEKPQKVVGFKSKKKVKTVKLTDDNDIY